MSTHMPGFQSFSGFLHHFVLAKLATSSISVNTHKPAQKDSHLCDTAPDSFTSGGSVQASVRNRSQFSRSIIGPSERPMID